MELREGTLMKANGGTWDFWGEPPAADRGPTVAEGVDHGVVLEGLVDVDLEATGSIKASAEFIRDLRSVPQLRMLQMIGAEGFGARVRLSLREPTDLLARLATLPKVADVHLSTEEGGPPVIALRLHRDQRPTEPMMDLAAVPMLRGALAHA